MGLTNYERDTIINFNEAEETAYIFTYNKTWQRHLEKVLGLKAVKTNRFGARDYELSKKWIKLPRTPRKISADTKARLVAQGKALKSKQRSREKVLQPESTTPTVK